MTRIVPNQAAVDDIFREYFDPPLVDRTPEPPTAAHEAETAEGEGGAIIANQAAIDAVFRECFAEPTDAEPEAGLLDDGTTEPAEPLTDAVLLDMARNAANGDKFSRLFDGDFADYPSQSEADLAFCQLLAFWTRKDPLAMDRLFRASGLFRSKWDDRHGRDTYGEATIRKAIERTKEVFSPQGDQSGPYFNAKGGLFWNRLTADGFSPVRLMNFSCFISREIVRDDGIERAMTFELKTRLKGREAVVLLPAQKFAAMNWPTELLGGRYILTPGQKMKEHARAGIQTVSGYIRRDEVYVHTGWRKVADDWLYLHAGGALGEAGPVAGIQTDLGQLDAFRLPDPLNGADLTRAVKETLTFFSLLPCGLGWPLLLAAFRAILAEANTLALSLYLAGQTGCFKTELAAIVQSFFGLAMADPANLPASWASTANALERLAFLAKDAVLTIDDFAPNGTAADVSRLHKTAENIFRGAGNRSGRQRMNADGSLRAVNHPRGLVLATGEDLPCGHSLAARLFVLELKPGDVPAELLTQGQAMAAAGTFNALTASFIPWAAGRLDGLKADYPKRKAYHRQTLAVGGHARAGTTVADLLTTAEVFSRFALDAGAMTGAEAGAWLERVRVDLLAVTGTQAEHLRNEDPVNRFFKLLAAALTSGRAYLADAMTGGPPVDAGLFGWKRGEETLFFPQGDKAGWLDGTGAVYLDPDAAFAVVHKLGRDQGAVIPLTQSRLWKNMRAAGLLQSHEPGRNQAKVKTEGAFRRVIHIHADQIFQRAGDGFHDLTDTGIDDFADPTPTNHAEQAEEWTDF